MKEKLLKTPQGAESIFLDEAYKHEKINEVINEIYTQWGYLPIKTPVFDYYETYDKLLSEENKKNCFRLMDRDGELLLLRNDITLFLARQLGRVTKKDDIMRVHYADTILRHQSEIDISSNEFFQTGAELVGAKGISGDLEAVTLLNKIITELNLPNTRIHLGSRAILDVILLKYNNVDGHKLITLINLRDENAILKYLSTFIDKEISKKISDLFMFIGKYTQYCDYLSKNKDFIKQIGIEKETAYLKEMGLNLEKLDLVNNFRFDLSEVANRDYYTGIVFKAYSQDIDSAVASGGRYDQLISSFGEAIPSVGFSILLRKIEDKIQSKRFNPPKMKIVEFESDFVKSYKKAEELRSNGTCAVIKGWSEQNSANLNNQGDK